MSNSSFKLGKENNIVLISESESSRLHHQGRVCVVASHLIDMLDVAKF